jgi:hypothetical protein
MKTETKSPKSLDQACTEFVERVRETLRTMHYSYRTESTCVDWIKRFIILQDKRHPKDMDSEELQAFIT